MLAQSSAYTEGVAQFENGNPARAIPLLTRAVEEQPGSAKAWKALGVAYAAQKRYTEAEPPLEHACSLDAGLADACYFYARVLYALDRFEPSIEVLRRTGERTWRIQLAMAQALEALGQAREAEARFRESVQLGGAGAAEPGVALSLFLIRQGRAAEAIPVGERVLVSFPDSGDAHLYLGRALLETGDARASIAELEHAVKLSPGSAQAHLLLANALMRTGRRADAEPHFQAAARLGEGK